MDRLTDPSQGYCEKYCENFGVPGCSPESCAMKHEVEMYEALKQLEGIVSFDRLIELAAADRDGEIIILPQTSHEKLLSDITKMVRLTLDQLREMDGQPVWIVESPDWGHWELSEDAEDYLCDRDTDLYGLTYPDPEGKAGLHKLGWVAYAYYPAHINREAWEPCGACKDGKITIHVPAFRAMAVCNQYMDHDAFDLTLRLKFCPWCGRPMSEEAWTELEKRIMGKNMTDGEL